MVDNVRTMPGCDLPGEPNEQLVEMLESFLDQARSGRITAMAGAFFTDDGCTGAFGTQPNGNSDHLISGLESIKYRYVKHIIALENEAQ